MRYIVALILILSFSFSSAQTDSIATHIYKMEEVDTPPTDLTTFLRYMYKNLRYPQHDKEYDIEGIVIVNIVIDETGKVCKPVITQSVSETIDKEVLRVLSIAPMFTPAKLNGKAVAVALELKFPFSLGN